MALESAQKSQIIQEFARNNKDTGSPEVQIAIFTARINQLTEHLKVNKKDHASRLGLLKIVGKRKRLMKYLKKTNREFYDKTIKSLGIRDNI
jgi:small subunit ribosomal protein S15